VAITIRIGCVLKEIANGRTVGGPTRCTDVAAGLSVLASSPDGRALAMAIGSHVPNAIPRFDESKISGGDSGIAKNLGVVSWIDSVEAARCHRPAALTAPVDVILRVRRCGAENAQRSGDCKRDEGLVSNHGQPSPFLRPIEIGGVGARLKSGDGRRLREAQSWSADRESWFWADPFRRIGRKHRAPRYP